MRFIFENIEHSFVGDLFGFADRFLRDFRITEYQTSTSLLLAMTHYKQLALIIGASSAIAQAVLHKLKAEGTSKVLAIGRNVEQLIEPCEQVDRFNCDYSEGHIRQVVEQIAEIDMPCTRVFVFNGVLHNEELVPEKKLEDFDVDNFQQVLSVNTILPMLWLKHLVGVINHASPCKFTVLSARVGSISDNRLGGWYSYRTSKAALNMLLKTAAVEYGRRAKNVKLVAFHPGTTDSPLSQPFQSNVPEDKLFTPEFVATRLLQITDLLEVDGQPAFLDWQGKTVNW